MDISRSIIRMKRAFPFIVALIIVDSIGISESSQGEAPVMDEDNETGYLHCENQEDDPGTGWWNTDPDDPESADHNHQSGVFVQGTDWAYDFAVRTGPNSAQSELEENITFDPTDAYVYGQIHLEFAVNEPSEIRLILDEEGTEHGGQTLPYESDNIYEFNFSIPDNTTAQSGNDLELLIRWASSTGDYEWTLYLDNTTFATLPIANDNDDDGEPDFRDDDDDNDGYNDTDEEDAGSDSHDSDSTPENVGDHGPPGTNDTGGNDDDDDSGFLPALVVPTVTTLFAVAIVIKKLRH